MNFRNISILLCLIFKFSFLQAQVQVDESSTFLDRVYTGGNLGFSISNNFTSVSVSPLVGYMITDRLSVGLGGTYQINSFKNIDFNLNNYGIRSFLRYNITQQFFAYTEYEFLSFEFITDFPDTAREGFNSLFVGGGYAIPLGERASIVAIALYNLAYDDFRSPYASPIVIRGGIVASF